MQITILLIFGLIKKKRPGLPIESQALKRKATSGGSSMNKLHHIVVLRNKEYHSGDVSRTP
jgi:hypothetical protein